VNDEDPGMRETVALRIEAPFARLTLARGAKRNALTAAMLAAIDAACERLEQADEVRVVRVDSSDPKAFCSGADIGEWGALPAQDMWRRWTRAGHRVFDRLAALPQPTIAEIRGIAFGGGLELALACDLRLATPDAVFAMPEVRVGAVPGWGGTRRLTRLIGAARTKQMVFRALRVDAATALAWGLVDEVVAADELAARTEAVAQEIAAGAPGAVRLAKQLIDRDAGGLDAETLAAGLAASLDDAREGIAAFAGKRPPRFRGR
jgi:enoyl-CoA hydratase/carnithine racemase